MAGVSITYDQLDAKWKATVDAYAKKHGVSRAAALKKLNADITSGLDNLGDSLTGSGKVLLDGASDVVTGGLGALKDGVDLGALNAVPNVINTVQDLIALVTSPSLWMRILQIAGGAALIILAFALIITQTKTGKAVGATAVKVATKGLV